METVRNDEAWQRLHERLRGIARRRAELDAEEARCLREAHDLKLWRRLGYAHMNEYLERELGYAPQAGVERLRVALALAALPQIEACLGDGNLAYSAVRELTRVATADTEQDWLAKARGKNLREIEAMVSGRKRGDRPTDPKNPDLVKRVLRLELSTSAFALFRQAQSAMAEEHGSHLDDTALVEILCRRALEGGGDTDRPPYQIAITQCEWCGRGWQNGAGREIDIDRNVIERARCDAELIGSLDADQPERLRTTVTLRVRRQVLARDHHRCTVPGCRSARNLDLHHIEYQSNGGSNEMCNLTTLCTAHHKSHHEGLLTIQGKAPHALEFMWRKPSSKPANADSVPTRQFTSSSPVVDPPSPFTSSSPVVDPAPPFTSSSPVIDPEPQRASSSSAIDPEPQRASFSSVIDPEPQRASSSQAIDPPLQSAGSSPAIDAARRRSNAVDGAGQRVMFNRSSVREAAQREDADDCASPALVDDQARTALVTAGYKSREARVAVAKARPHVGAPATLEQVLREALRQCALMNRISHLPASSRNSC
ncbi:MAG TPA: hypothetical protein VGD80_19135 [Kofleriaceae bacterium]